MSLKSALQELKSVSSVSKAVSQTPKKKVETAKKIPTITAIKHTPTKATEVPNFKPVQGPVQQKKTTTKRSKTPYGTKGYLVSSKGDKLPRVVNPVATGLTKVTTFGASSLLPGMKEAEKQSAEQFPISYNVGQALGYVGPTTLAKGVTKGLVKGATKKLGTEIGKNVAEGAIIGTGAEATQIVKPLLTGEMTPQQAGKQLATGLVAGIGIDVGIGVLGKIAKPILSKIKAGKVLSQADKVAVAKSANVGVEEVDNLIKQTLNKQRTSQLKSVAEDMETPIVKPILEEPQGVKTSVDVDNTLSMPKQQTIVKPLIEQSETTVKDIPIVKPIKSIAEDMGKPISESIEIPIDTQQRDNFRRTIHNSLMQSELPDDLKKAYEATPSVYNKANNEDDWAKAWEKVSRDYDNAKSTLQSKDALNSADDTMEYIALLQQASKKNISEAKQLADEFAEKGTKAGQAIQAIVALQKTTPEGQLVRATQTIKGVEDAFKESNPTLGKEYDNASKEIKKAINNAKNDISNSLESDIINSSDDTLNDILEKNNIISKKTRKSSGEKVEKTPEEMLADKINNKLTAKVEPKEKDLIKQMVNDLFRKAKPKIGIPTIKTPSTLIDDLKLPIETRQEYARVWNASKHILKDELDPELFNQIEEFIQTGVRPTFDEKKLDRLIKQTMTENDIKLSELVKKFSKNQMVDRSAIKESIIKELGLEGADADYVARFIEKNLKDNIKAKREQLLATHFKDIKLKGEYKSKTADIINLGGLENQKYKDQFTAKLSPDIKNALKQKDLKLDDIVRLSRDTQLNISDDVVNGILQKLDVDVKYYDQLRNAATEVLKEMSDKKKQSIIKNMLRERKEIVYKPMRERITELYNLDAFNDLLKEKYKLPTLSDEEARQIVDLMEQGNNATGREQEMLYAKVDQMIADKVPTSIADKVRALRNMSLLGNIKTIGIRNPLGNVIFSGLENVSQIPSGITDVMVSKILKTPRTTKVLPNLLEQGKGFKKGVSEAWEDIINNVDTSPTRGGAELPRNRKVFETAWLNKANNWLGDALKIGDRPFYQAAYDARLKELKQLQPNIDEAELQKLAKEFGLERTFQNSSTTSKAMGMIKRGFNLGKDFGVGDIVMPYTQTPANILEKGVQYTPLNLINIGAKIGGQALGKETIRNNPKAFADAVGRMFTGTGAIALGYKLASEGAISGTQKGDSTKEKAIKKQVGEQQYSVKIGDKWYSFDWAQPASIPLAIGADMYLSGQDKATALEKIQAGATSGLDTVFNQSMMQGIARMFGGTSVSTGIVESMAGAPTQFVPTLLGQTAQQIDPYKRDADYSSIPEQVKTTAMKKIPTLREQLPATLDLFGKPIKEQGGSEGILKALKVFISPTNVSDETSDKISKEIYNLYKRTGETDVIPSKMPTGLTKDQEYQFKQTFGQEVRNRLETIMVGSYDNLSDDAKVRMLRKEINNAYDKAKDTMNIGKK